ncbi:hypothetical protein SAMN05216516_107115 [Izhakiella capsodis]|uniref:Pilus assembly protein HofN n=1 Tax=Izhakiella capsodis TaxID=1367852 RepID=A0A1I4YZL8_9GAMM|nr:hypothetical protein [Izhakiella capsodis]SFN43454.1 hypothetical protein SAMN05216516_107115 [Izhakiella capsodis]
MVWVNLLPWRERRLASLRRIWLKGLLTPFALLCAVALVITIQRQFNSLKAIENQTWRQSQMQLKHVFTQKTALQRQVSAGQVKLDKLERRHQRLMRWQKLMTLLGEKLPVGLWLTEIRGDVKTVTFTGRCAQVEDSALLRKALLNARLFDRLLVTHFRRASSGTLDFTLVGHWSEAGSDD